VDIIEINFEGFVEVQVMVEFTRLGSTEIIRVDILVLSRILQKNTVLLNNIESCGLTSRHHITAPD